MAPEPFQNVLVLTGPTGSGKTRLGIQLAERLNAEIISMDSMALYRGMDIGTAKPSQEERSRVRHHLLDVLDPWESASVVWWLKQAADCCRDIECRGKQVLIVGGTPLYLKALFRGIFPGPAAEPEVRRRLSAEAERQGALILHERLTEIDPPAAARIHPHDVRRVIRALEVFELTGQPMSAWQTQWIRGQGAGSGDQERRSSVSPSLRPSVSLSRCLWLDSPRAELYARIEARVEWMIQQGLVEEARALRKLPRPISGEACQALGYKEMFDHLDGRTTLEGAIAQIKIRSRHFAKRQLTWFRHLPECLSVSEESTFAAWGLTMGAGERKML